MLDLIEGRYTLFSSTVMESLKTFRALGAFFTRRKTC